MKRIQTPSFLAHNHQKKYRKDSREQLSDGVPIDQNSGFGKEETSSISDSSPILSAHRSWMKITSGITLVGYLGQLACQIITYPLLAGSLSLVPSYSAGAMECDDSDRGEFLSFSSSSSDSSESQDNSQMPVRYQRAMGSDDATYTPYVFKNSDATTDKIIAKIFSHSGNERTLGRASQVCRRWHNLISSLDRPALAFDREREELIGRILEATDAEFSPIAVARRNPNHQAIYHLLVEPEQLLISGQERNFLLSPHKTTDHPFFGGIIEREKKLSENSCCSGNVISQYRRYREHCVKLQGDMLDQYITPKAILYIDDQRIYRISRSLAYKINSINEYNIAQRENDAGNHAVCQLGQPGRSVHFKNNNCHTDLSPAMEIAMYGFYSLIAPHSVTPSFFMRIEELPIKSPNPIYHNLKEQWNEVERGDKTFTSFINCHADKQKDLFKENPQNFILQGSRTAEGMRFDKFLEKVTHGQASYEDINKESFSYHILLSLLFNPSDYKADNLFIDPEGHIVGIDNDGCLANPIVYLGRSQREYHVGVKNIL